MSLRRLCVPFLLLVVAGLSAPPVSAGDWTKLGSRIVNDRLDHDTIVVTAAKGDFRALKLFVHKTPVHILDMKVTFGNGGVQDVSIRSRIPAGGESRVIDLTGADRVIRKVEFWYEANSLGRRRATIELWGLQ
jgi:hypothetical protein